MKQKDIVRIMQLANELTRELEYYTEMENIEELLVLYLNSADILTKLALLRQKIEYYSTEE